MTKYNPKMQYNIFSLLYGYRLSQSNGLIQWELFLKFVASNVEKITFSIKNGEERREVQSGWMMLSICQYLTLTVTLTVDILDYQIIRSLSDSRRNTATEPGTTPDTPLFSPGLGEYSIFMYYVHMYIFHKRSILKLAVFFNF